MQKNTEILNNMTEEEIEKYAEAIYKKYSWPKLKAYYISTLSQIVPDYEREIVNRALAKHGMNLRNKLDENKKDG
jgi:hypothetical protein